MRKTLLISFFLLLLSFSAYSQDISSDEIEKLNQEMANLNSQGKRIEAIKIAEKIVSIEKNKGLDNTVNYIAALTNLVRLKNTQLNENLNLWREGKVMSNDNFRPEVEEVEGIFRDLVKIYQKDLPNDLAGLASAKIELAYFLEFKPRISFRDNYKGVYQITDEIEKLLLDALQLREKSLGKDSILTLSAIFKLADFYSKKSEIEKQWIYCQEYINAFENKFGKKDKRFIPALQMYEKLLVTTDKNAEAEQIHIQITEILGKETPKPQADFEVKYKLDSELRIVLGEDLKAQAFSDGIRNAATTGNIRFSLDINTFFIPVKVLINESGKVIESNFETNNEKYRKDIEERLKKVKFKPLILNGVPSKMRGIIVFNYYTKKEKEKNN
jgi:hypothetical protein